LKKAKNYTSYFTNFIFPNWNMVHNSIILIKENLNEYFSNFEVREKKDKNEKQLKLDVFLID